ncbi:MAG: hypothetical protein DWQ47_05215 [Acidobacteria bacterium]|nr:MAG: hypothetical protein DWQ32_08765 [Acidobacteriota bacterium]REK01781.1 MAG: hypothetical protein DWQ38_05200 [Acidobacteriota bacterium]REK14737.1 MAG: hypothetical protein DWQ43_14455 [Acidobacteriota bacterium]REK45452.1 MAG: hypothetical protein DWQ47_05215 [Acidobacteriota bacterium]
MIDLLRFLKDQVFFSRRIAEDKERQERDGFTVQLISEGPNGHWAVYQENTRETRVGVSFGWFYQSLYVDEIKRWEPMFEEVSAAERRRIVDRVARHLSCWGGEVRFEKGYVHESRDLRTLLEAYGIPFKISGEFLVHDPTNNENTLQS